MNHYKLLRRNGSPYSRQRVSKVAYENYQDEHKIWTGIKSRCMNVNDPSYERYGGRGITVFDAWKENFNNFINDVGHRPSLLHSIDRINNDGNYEPGNVRWATHSEQVWNRRKSKTNTSGYIGVYPYKNRWGARTRVGSKTIYGGIFDTPEEAAIEYDKMIIFLRDGNSVTNFL